MGFAYYLQVFFALAVTIGLVLLAAVALRRMGPEGLARFQRLKPDRRMTLIETLVLDPTRRLVLIRLDGEERLLLLGEGRTLETLKKPPAPSRRKAPETAA